MKIAKLDHIGHITIFPSITMAAEDAGMTRQAFSKKINNQESIKTFSGVYSIPTVLKTKRYG